MIDPEDLEIEKRRYLEWTETELKSRLQEIESQIDKREEQIQETSMFDPNTEGLQYQLGRLLDEKEEIENHIKV